MAEDQLPSCNGVVLVEKLGADSWVYAEESGRWRTMRDTGDADRRQRMRHVLARKQVAIDLLAEFNG